MEGSIKELVSHRISRAEEDLATSMLFVLLILSMDLTALSTAAL